MAKPCCCRKSIGLWLDTENKRDDCFNHWWVFAFNPRFDKTSWPKSRRRFSALEASKMAGKLARLTEGAPWARYLLSQLYTSIAFALAQNKVMLEKLSPEFKKLAKTISSGNFSPFQKANKDHQSTVRFALKKAARMVHNFPAEYKTILSMKEELAFSKKSWNRHHLLFGKPQLPVWPKRHLLPYSWIAHELQVGTSLERRHNLVQFQFWDHFGFLSPNYTGQPTCVFFVKSKSGLVWSVFTFF